jgi:hypothetical protein
MKFQESQLVTINKSKSNKIKKTNTNHIKTDAFNVEEIMTKNKLKKFREIGGELNTSVGKGDDTK